MQMTLEVSDLYLRKPPFSFSAIKAGDIAFFKCGKALTITKKLKPDSKGQSWFGLQFEGNHYGVYGSDSFNQDGICENTAAFDITHILKTGVKLNGK